MLDEYLQAVAQCRTDNEIRRIHIQIEIECTPAAVFALTDQARARRPALPPVCTQWLERMDELVRKDGRPLQGFAAAAVTRSATLFAAPGDAATRARRKLVIAYSGHALRLMVPLPMFLQYCPADRCELLVMVDYKKKFYLNGVDGLGHDLPSTMEAIAARFPQVRQGNAMAFGTSAGGLAAVWTAVALGLPRAVSVAGATPDAVKSTEVGQQFDVSGFDEAIRRNAGRLPEVLVVTGAEAVRDSEKAREIQKHLPATHISVPGGATHNVLYDAWQNGHLEALMERLLGDPA